MCVCVCVRERERERESGRRKGRKIERECVKPVFPFIKINNYYGAVGKYYITDSYIFQFHCIINNTDS